jgi:hypothetical protein
MLCIHVFVSSSEYALQALQRTAYIKEARTREDVTDLFVLVHMPKRVHSMRSCQTNIQDRSTTIHELLKEYLDL